MRKSAETKPMPEGHLEEQEPSKERSSLGQWENQTRNCIRKIREESASNTNQCLLHLAPKGSWDQSQRNGGSYHTILQCAPVYRK